MGSTRISGYHVELHTYDWYLQNVKNEIKYLEVKSEEDIPCIQIKTKNTYFHIELDNATLEFYLTDENKKLIARFLSIDEAHKNIDYYA